MRTPRDREVSVETGQNRRSNAEERVSYGGREVSSKMGGGQTKKNCTSKF